MTLETNVKRRVQLGVMERLSDLQRREPDVEAELHRAELPQVFADLRPQQEAPPISHRKRDVDRNLRRRGPRDGRRDVQQLETQR